MNACGRRHRNAEIERARIICVNSRLEQAIWLHGAKVLMRHGAPDEPHRYEIVFAGVSRRKVMLRHEGARVCAGANAAATGSFVDVDGKRLHTCTTRPACLKIEPCGTQEASHIGARARSRVPKLFCRIRQEVGLRSLEQHLAPR